MSYKIELRFTCPYIGSRNGGDRTIATGLSRKQAYRKLLDIYNDLFADDRGYASHWGIAVIKSRRFVDGAGKTQGKGLRGLNYDSRIFVVVKE